MAILICTQDFDVHAESVAEQINLLGGDALLFKRYNLENYITYHFSGDAHACWVSIDGNKYLLSRDIQGILWRIKPILLSEIPGAESSMEDKFRMHEWRQALYPLEDFSMISVNPMNAQTKMNRKASQIKLAIECGLMIPTTVISNFYLDILGHLDDEDLVYKTQSSFVTDDQLIFTNKVEREKIKSSSSSIALAPGIFQNLVEKSYELRVVIVAKNIFISKIDSQKKSLTTLDWRYDQSKSMFSDGVLSDDIQNKLFDFHEKSGLIFATYDFIVDTEGNEIFLECNPNGQWLFVEEDKGRAISEALARTLLLINM